MNPTLDNIDKDIHITGCYKTHPTARSFYARSANKYVHRIVMERILGAEIPKDKRVDHVNGDGLDCRRDNLRLVTHAQNLANRPGWRSSSSIYKGVTLNKQRNKWQAKITVGGHTIHLGYFEDEKDAAKSYDKYAINAFKDCAFINIKDTP